MYDPHAPTNLQSALDWLHQVISGSLKIFFGKADNFTVSPLESYPEESSLARFVRQYQPSTEEFTVLMLALSPHISSNYLGKIIAEFLPEGGDIPEFGAVKGNAHRGILPTGETAQFILAGNNLANRLAVSRMFDSSHWFSRYHILRLEAVPEGEPMMSGRLVLDAEVIELLSTGKVSKPRFRMEFPAEPIETEMAWDDLVLHPQTLMQIRDIENWVKYNDTLLRDWGMSKKIKTGYRALFYGPPGTGKTLTSTLLGKFTGKDVFRIDLSRVVSKYIGETEKNLARLFDKAENKDWILFFDEADALFGKRTEIRDAHDKYANQEVAYLLQRIENYNGLVILATNQRSNIDDAFTRRFQAIIHFPLPRPEERHQIWLKTLPAQVVHTDIDWPAIAVRYELSGAGILNVIHYCSISLLASGSTTLSTTLLESAIQREFVKEGKMF